MIESSEQSLTFLFKEFHSSDLVFFLGDLAVHRMPAFEFHILVEGFAASH